MPVTIGAAFMAMSVALPESGWPIAFSVGQGRSPRGVEIESKGVVPDYLVEGGMEDWEAGRDWVLETGLRILRERL